VDGEKHYVGQRASHQGVGVFLEKGISLWRFVGCYYGLDCDPPHFFFFGGTGVSTQGFVLAKPGVPLLEPHLQSSFALVILEMQTIGSHLP
jgi:hypothetical protein